MLRKNVYIVFPAGYHGNYVKWSIESSDYDTRTSVPDNPTNNTNSKEFGGVGTSHLATRIPTHARWFIIRSWMLFNKPQEKKVYVINSGNDILTHDISASELSDILIQDPDGIVISIHNNDDADIASYAKINIATKWPTNIHLSNVLKYNRNIDNSYDPFDCADSLSFRNKVVTGDVIFGVKGTIPDHKIGSMIDKYNDWYDARLELQPHELESGNYPHDITWKDRYFSLSCKSIVTPEFPVLFKQILDSAQLSDNYDIEPLSKAHESYLSVQPNLQWFDSVANWRACGEIDSYIKSHAIIQAEIIKRIFEAAPELKSQIDWQNMSIQEINAKYLSSIAG